MTGLGLKRGLNGPFCHARTPNLADEGRFGLGNAYLDPKRASFGTPGALYTPKLLFDGTNEPYLDPKRGCMRASGALLALELSKGRPDDP